MVFATLFRRIAGAAVLDPNTYEDVETDPHATWQAAVTVLGSSIAAGIGAGGWHGAGWRVILLVASIAVVTWLAWAMLTYQLGSRWMRGPETSTSFGELTRTVGFAAAPGFLQAFAAFPNVGPFVFAVAWIWMFAAMVIAVQHALDYRRVAQAVAVCGVAAALSIALAFMLSALTARTAY